MLLQQRCDNIACTVPGCSVCSTTLDTPRLAKRRPCSYVNSTFASLARPYELKPPVIFSPRKSPSPESHSRGKQRQL